MRLTPRRLIPLAPIRLSMSLLLPVLLVACSAGPTPYIPPPPLTPEARAQFEALEPDALEQVLRSSRSDRAEFRSNALEAMQARPDRSLPLAQAALDDPNPAVRYAALVTIGRLRHTSLAPAVSRLRDDPVEYVRAAADFAAAKLGRRVDLTPLASLLASDNATDQGVAVNLLGWLDDPTAAPMIRELTGQPMPRASQEQIGIVRLQAAEALVMLGDDEALQPIRAGTFIIQPEIAITAVQIAGRLQDRAVTSRLRTLALERDPKKPVADELRIAAATALAQMNIQEGLPVLLDAAQRQNVTFDGQTYPATGIRAQAAYGLGWFRDGQAAAALATLLQDPEEAVRLAAAAGVLRATAPRQTLEAMR